MPTIRKMLTAAVLLVLLSLTIATPAYAFDGRGGDKVVIGAGEVINDDLYSGANEFVLNGTVNGDTAAFGQIVTINGTINGDLMSAAQTVVINGTVTGSVRMAGSVLFVGEKARIGGDIVAAGYSLEVRSGGTVARDVVIASGQTLLAANVGRNVLAYTGGLQIDGDVTGNVKAFVGEANQDRQGPPPTMFMNEGTVPIPNVRPGLSIDPEAKIGGSLDYTQDADLVFPAGVVTGKITRAPQPEDQNMRRAEPSTEQRVGTWALNSGRSLITLLLLGLFLLWLLPLFTTGLSDQLERQPGPSLLWGVVTYAGFFFILLLILFVMLFSAIIFGVLTLGSLSATVVFVGLLALFAIILAFVLATSFLAKIVFGLAIGRWILSQLHSPLAAHRYWPMVIGVALTVVVIALLSFPLIPGLLGFLLNVLIIFFGLGALWLWARARIVKPAPLATA